MKVFAREIKGAIWGKLGVCAKGAGLVWLAFALMLVGCKNNAGGGAPSAQVRKPAPQLPKAEDKEAQAQKITFTFTDDETVATVKVDKTEDGIAFSEILAKSADLASYVKGEDSFEGWAVSGSDEIVADDETFAESTTFVAKYAASAVLASYNFYDGENKLNSKAIKVRGAVTFASLVAKAGDALNGTTSEELFVGWKVKGKDVRAVDEMEFSESTDFEAVYREKAKYREHISASDILGHGWYSAATKSHLVFTEDRSAYEITGKKFTVAQEIIAEYLDMEANSGKKGAKYTSDDSAKFREQHFSSSYMWMNSDAPGSWNNEWESSKVITLMDYATYAMTYYYISPDGEELVTIDADGTVKTAYVRID